jgi:hypothetical protein
LVGKGAVDEVVDVTSVAIPQMLLSNVYGNPHSKGPVSRCAPYH